MGLFKQNRVPRGVPTGGEWAEGARGEPDLSARDEHLLDTWSEESISSDRIDELVDDDLTRISRMRPSQRETLLEREAEALDPATGPERLDALAGHQDSLVRSAAASRHDLDPRTLITLRDDPNPFVRVAALENSSMPTRALVQYASTESGSAELRASLKGRESDSQIALAVASNREAPADLLSELATSKDADVQTAVATNPRSTPEVLNYLAAHPTSDVRAAVAANPGVPPVTFTRLEKETDDVVVRSVDRQRRTQGSAFYDGRDVREAKEHEALQRAEAKQAKKMAKRGLTPDGQPVHRPYAPRRRKPRMVTRVARFGWRIVNYWILRRSYSMLMKALRSGRR